MQVLAEGEVAGGGRWKAVVTERRDGDMAVTQPGDLLEERRRRVVDLPWIWLQQVHGGDALGVASSADAGQPADALVSSSAGLALSIQVADCVPVALVAPGEGVIAAAHAGWRGLVAGVLESAVDLMRARGASRILAAAGPSICPAHYEFGADDLERVVEVVGEGARSRAISGAPALDLRSAVSAVLGRSGVEVAALSGRCTAEDPDLFSFRARRDEGRFALVVWTERVR